MLLAIIAGCSPVEDSTLFPEYTISSALPPPPKEPIAFDENRHLLWGDLHIHTSLSMDAWINGVRTTPDDAYTFTRGGAIPHAAGYSIRISRPLDFAAVTDHAEYLGVAGVSDIEHALEKRSLRERLLNDGPLMLTWAFIQTVKDVNRRHEIFNIPGHDAISRSAWQDTIAAAERHYDPGTFTTLVAYEWSSKPEKQTLHRNVIYRSSQAPEMTYSALDSFDPEDLWDALDAQRDRGIGVLAIPHNGNISNGKMYDSVTLSGEPFDAAYATQRMRNEPLSEIFQVKGSSETHPQLSPSDGFADFELMFNQDDPENSKVAGSYARYALRTGLEFSHSEGFNPYKFGVIGSSDSHNSSSTPDEANHHGKLPMFDGTAAIRSNEAFLLPDSSRPMRAWGSGGLAAVWATENTREAIFDALRRKETYATSGPRIQLRFFAGWQFAEDIVSNPDRIRMAYEQGVPMGSILNQQGSTTSPRFLLWAQRDPDGANLDRLQVIKGFVDQQGQSHEKVFDVAAGEGRQKGKDGYFLPVGSTVDLSVPGYENTIGAAQLAVQWTDPEFDPAQDAFYYARAIEIPTPRYSTYDAVKLGIEPPEPSVLQERAVTSAIWYQPD
jgi:hypothetical protein